jgi:hypothetical protein
LTENKGDYFPDLRSVIFHVERNRWYIECVRFVDDDMLYDDALQVTGDYNNIYLPLTLEHCLVIHESKIINAHIPTWENHDTIQLQQMSIVGKDFDMITMEMYWELQKLETLHIKTPTEN